MLTTVLLIAALSVFQIAAHPDVGGANSPVDLRSAAQVRTAPRQSVPDTYSSITRKIAIASLQKRDTYRTNFSLEKTWQDATIMLIERGGNITQKNTNQSLTSIEVTCKYCYSRGIVTAELTVDDNFNATQAISDTTNDVQRELGVLRDNVTIWVEGYAQQVWANVLSDGPDWADFDLPTFNSSFDLDITPVPAANLRFRFDEMELYVDMMTKIDTEATYEISLFVSQTPAGFMFGGVLVGFVLTVDLILSVDGEIAIDSGFHIKLDDGVELNVALFGKQVSDMKFNGGQFEFLPVTIESAGVTLSAALRVGVSLGISVDPHSGSKPVDVAAGIMMEVFANVAEFTTEVKYDAKNTTCALQVVNDYKLAVGAYGGASMEVRLGEAYQRTVAAVGSVSTAIFTTTLAEICVLPKVTPSIGASVSPVVERREDLTTTTLTTQIVNTAVSCTITGLANCPVSAQVTTKGTVTKTIITAVPSDWSPEYPQATLASILSTVPFGSAVNKIHRTTGKPTAYTPAAIGTLTGLKEKAGGLSKKAIIGISVGIVVPATLILLGCCLFCWRRKKRVAKTQHDQAGRMLSVSNQNVGEEEESREK